MLFSTDRALLVYEPQLFRDIVFAGQTLIKVSDAVVVSTTLTSVLANFVQGQVQAGHVAMVNGLPVEVLSAVDANTLSVSLIRKDPSDAAIAPGDVTGGELEVRSFQAQATIAHDQLLKDIGIDEDDPDKIASENQIVSLSVMSQLEVLGILQHVYRVAVALVGDNKILQYKANEYKVKYESAVHSARAWVDLDGDGVADFCLKPGVGELIRK